MPFTPIIFQKVTCKSIILISTPSIPGAKYLSGRNSRDPLASIAFKMCGLFIDNSNFHTTGRRDISVLSDDASSSVALTRTSCIYVANVRSKLDIIIDIMRIKSKIIIPDTDKYNQAFEIHLNSFRRRPVTISEILLRIPFTCILNSLIFPLFDFIQLKTETDSHEHYKMFPSILTSKFSCLCRNIISFCIKYVNMLKRR